MLVQVGKRFVSEQREIDQQFASGMKGLLAKSKVFKECHEDFVRDLIVSSNRKEIPPNRYLMEEGMRGDSMFVLFRGVVEVTCNGRYVCKLRDGSIVGEAALLNIDNRRTASIRSVHKCDVAIIFRSTFHSILEKYPWEKRKFQRDMKAKLMELGKLVDAKEDINLEQQASQCDALKRVSFFSGDGDMHDFVAELSMSAISHWYRPGTVIIQEGDTRCDEMFVLLRGAVEVSACGEFLGRLENDLFGEIGVLDLLERRTAHIVAATQCHCMCFTRQVVIPVLAKYPEARMRLLEHARQRLVALNAAVGGTGLAATEKPLRLPGCAVGFGSALQGDDARLFAASGLLCDAREDLLVELSCRLSTRKYDDGQTIFSEGDAFHDLVCWVAQGQVEVWCTGHFVGLFGEGEVFGGLAAVIEGAPAAQENVVKSKGPVVLRVVKAAVLQDLLRSYEDPEFALRWRAEVAAKAQQLSRRVPTRGLTPPAARRLDFTFMKLPSTDAGGARVPALEPLDTVLSDTCRTDAGAGAGTTLRPPQASLTSR